MAPTTPGVGRVIAGVIGLGVGFGTQLPRPSPLKPTGQGWPPAGRGAAAPFPPKLGIAPITGPMYGMLRPTLLKSESFLWKIPRASFRS